MVVGQIDFTLLFVRNPHEWEPLPLVPWGSNDMKANQVTRFKRLESSSVAGGRGRVRVLFLHIVSRSTNQVFAVKDVLQV